MSGHRAPNKSRSQLFPVVLERQRLADALGRTLDTLGLERRVREAADLSSSRGGSAEPLSLPVH